MAEMTPNTYQERLTRLKHVHNVIIAYMRPEFTPVQRDEMQDQLNTWIDAVAQNLLDDTLEIPDPPAGGEAK